MTVSRRDFVRKAASGLGAISLGARLEAAETGKRAADKPNVLFVMTDQQSLRAMSAYGNTHVSTPHMDSIAADGVRFEKSYCTSPVCGPSRSSLITGMMPHETGVDVNGQSIRPGIANMGMIFREAGYQTAWAGKWHLPESYPETATIPGFDKLPVEKPTGSGTQTDGKVADQAVKFLRAKHGRPFLLAVSLHNPHDICGWTGRKPVKHADFSRFPPLPDNFAVDPDEPEFIKKCRMRKYYGPENTHTKNWDKNQWRAYLGAYYKFTERVDGVLGRVLSALREQGLEKNTLVVFTSDHGEGMAAHQWVVKLMLHEAPATVPFVVSWKGVTPPGKVDKRHLVSGLDILPTMCDYAGIGIPGGVRGMSLRPLIENPNRRGREFVVSELQPFPKEPHRRGRMLRTDRYKYVAFSEGANPEMLFDLDADPGETRNLASSPAMQRELAKHRRLLAAWIGRTNDEFRVPGLASKVTG